MLDALNSLLDPYDRKARVAPALLCGLPLFVSMALLIPEIGTIWATVGGLLLYCGGATFRNRSAKPCQFGPTAAVNDRAGRKPLGRAP